MDLRDYNLQACVDCPLCDAPGCFRRVLIRALELGSVNYLPTNWQGFAEYFSLEDSASSPKELVNHWADEHPNRRQHTIRKIFEYAVKKQHKLLLEEFHKMMAGSLSTLCHLTLTIEIQLYCCSFLRTRFFT